MGGGGGGKGREGRLRVTDLLLCPGAFCVKDWWCGKKMILECENYHSHIATIPFAKKKKFFSRLVIFVAKYFAAIPSIGKAAPAYWSISLVCRSLGFGQVCSPWW